MGRVFVIKPGTKIGLAKGQPSSMLQRRSERRAIVDFIIDNRCVATIDQINEQFGFDCRHKVSTLVRVGWLEILPDEEAA